MSGTSVIFDTWSHDSLVKFSSECYERLQEQEKEIEALREDLRAAIDAYRQLVVTNARKAN
jgi:hypothetical protein